ncbi:MAG TPA: hypothetical protein DEU93_02600 [Chitinophagaceae bacterium]|nr:hypothetical protein [Chitinophagaceae bacterium]HML57515.1 YqgE/AlgH family protein [Ferruginibacter sp.]
MSTLMSGGLLVADPFLKDENFMRSVVLLCRHTEEGSFGFVLNKKLDVTVDELLAEMEGLKLTVYQGGPVQLDTVHYIHQYPDLIPDSHLLTDTVCWGGNFQQLTQHLKNGTISPSKVKFFLGYSGWEAGQLEKEMEERSWATTTGTRKLIFNTTPEALWRNTMLHMGGVYEQMVNYPIDPQLN